MPRSLYPTMLLAIFAFPASVQINATEQVIAPTDHIVKTAVVKPTADPIKQYQQERKKFLTATKALAKRKSSTFNKLKKELIHYPLHPYLDYAYIASHLNQTKAATIDDFLVAQENSSLEKRLRHIWLEHLRRKNKWREYLTYYQAKSANVEQQCFYQLAQYRNGQQQEATSAALKLWTLGKSHPSACDKIFAILIKKKFITQDIAWQRYTSAIINHEYRLARYLQRFFTSKEVKDKANKYYATHTSPEKIITQKNYTDTSEENKKLIQHSIAHLSKKSAISATTQWVHYSKQFEFNDSEENYVVRALIKSLYKSKHDGIADDLLRSSISPKTVSLVETRIRKALASLDWASVRYWIKKLPTGTQENDRWKYWLARAEEQLSPKDSTTSQQKYAQLAQERSFFGYLAADKTQQPYLLKNKSSTITSATMASAISNPSLVRARELFLLGDYNNARREWRFATNNSSTEFMIAASILASNIGWHSQAAYGAVITKQWDDLSLRFPADYLDIYEKNSAKQKLPIELMLALSRQESSFATDALSPSGAKGLMQLMPKTAKYIARKSKIRYKSEKQLFEAEKNVELGTAYYRYLMNGFDDNRILSTSSYNAGPNRTRQWLKKSAGKLPPDVWTEIIPFNETRRYVQNVLYFSVVYGLRNGTQTILLTKEENNTLL